MTGPFTHVLLLDGDLQHRPREALAAARRRRADRRRSGPRRAAVQPRVHAGGALSREPDRQPCPVVVRRRARARLRSAGSACAALDALRNLPLEARGYDIETEMLVKLRRSGARLASVPITAVYAAERSKLRPVRDTTRTCFLAVYSSVPRTHLTSPWDACPCRSTTRAEARAAPVDAARPQQRRGFQGDVYQSCAGCPKAGVVCDRRRLTWLASRLMPATRAAIGDNLRAVFPEESPGALERRARAHAAGLRARHDRLRSRAVARRRAARRRCSIRRLSICARFNQVLAEGRGAILVTGHYGNWEIGSVLMSRVLHLPLTIIAMAEASAEVNRLRREIRDRMGVDTIEVRQSLDTALQIRRRLSEQRHRGDVDGSAPRSGSRAGARCSAGRPGSCGRRR